MNKTIPSSLTICKHSDLDSYTTGRKAFYPWGCVDGKVTDSTMAKRMEFLGRQGPACGTPFNVKSYLQEHPEYKEWRSVMRDMPTYKWVKL